MEFGLYFTCFIGLQIRSDVVTVDVMHSSLSYNEAGEYMAIGFIITFTIEFENSPFH